MFFFYHGQKGKTLAEITNTIFINVKEEETVLPVPQTFSRLKEVRFLLRMTFRDLRVKMVTESKLELFLVNLYL